MCNAITRNGTTCKAKTAQGEDYCARHKKTQDQVTCDFVLTRGSRKGQVCGAVEFCDGRCRRHSTAPAPAAKVGGAMFTALHVVEGALRKSVGPFANLGKCWESFQGELIDAPEDFSAIATVAMKVDDTFTIIAVPLTAPESKATIEKPASADVTYCPHKFVRGLNAGSVCGKKVKEGFEMCSKHLKKAPSSSPKAPKASKSKKPSPPPMPHLEPASAVSIPKGISPAVAPSPKKKRSSRPKWSKLTPDPGLLLHKQDTIDISLDDAEVEVGEIFDAFTFESNGVQLVYDEERTTFVLQNPQDCLSFDKEQIFEAAEVIMDFLSVTAITYDVLYNGRELRIKY